MILAVLLLIAAILLFGSSVVIGAIGQILGAILGIFALALLLMGLQSATGMEADRLIPVIVLGICGLAAAIRLIVWIVQRYR